MNKILLLSAFIIFTFNFAFAKIWRVNNNSGVTADFTTAQAANNAASVLAGDTIHLEPSITSYGGLSVSKRLTWISTGAFLSIHPGLQYSPNVGRVDNLSAYTAGCANSVFHIYIVGSASLGQTGVRLDRCYVGNNVDIGNYVGPLYNSIVVINSYCRGGISISYHSNIIVTNNIFEDDLSVTSGATLAVVTHNVFNAVTTGVSIVNNSLVENNIFNKAGSPITFINSTVQYNMSGMANILPAGNNNQNGVNMTNVFVNDDGLDDASFVLKAGSPAIAAGSAGVDMGAFGGGSPFRLALQPGVPAIYKIQASAAPAGNTMNVTFSTKSNN